MNLEKLSAQLEQAVDNGEMGVREASEIYNGAVAEVEMKAWKQRQEV